MSAALGAAFVLAACTPVGPPPPTTTTTMPVSDTPQIVAFGPTRALGTAPLTTAFVWSLSGPEGSTLTCTLDVDDDGAPEAVVSPCTNSSIRSTTYATSGARTARLTVTDGTTPTEATADVTVSPPAADAFDVTVRFGGTPTPTQQAAFTAAAARWSEVIRTGLADVAVDAAAGSCVEGAPAYAGPVDDVLIEAIVAPIDGPGLILGQAGPCLIRTAGGLTAYGVMQFDVADVAELEATDRLEAVILHEMGHVLGFGTLWGPLVVGAGSGYPSFVGPVARGAWNAIGGSGDAVPVEGSGGPGTADAHWSEAVFDNELMTGFINGTSNPLSAVTIGSLADLGYGVDLGAADPFGTPALRAPSTATPWRGVLLRPIGEV